MIEEMKLQIQHIDEVLSSANVRARNIDKVDPDSRNLYLPQRTGPSQLYVYNTYLYMYASSDLMVPRLLEGPLSRGTRVSILPRNFDNETVQRAMNLASTPKLEQGRCLNSNQF